MVGEMDEFVEVTQAYRVDGPATWTCTRCQQTCVGRWAMLLMLQSQDFVVVCRRCWEILECTNRYCTRVQCAKDAVVEGRYCKRHAQDVVLEEAA